MRLLIDQGGCRGAPQSQLFCQRWKKKKKESPSHIWALLGIPASDLSDGVGAPVGENVQIISITTAIK